MMATKYYYLERLTKDIYYSDSALGQDESGALIYLGTGQSDNHKMTTARLIRKAYPDNQTGYRIHPVHKFLDK